jgi:hypothetical protein
MRTIQEATERIINQTPFWVEAMDEKLLNLSSLARKIQPQVEEELMKNVILGDHHSTQSNAYTSQCQNESWYSEVYRTIRRLDSQVRYM